MKLFVYNFNGEIIESHEAFTAEIRVKTRECYNNGEPMSRQIICGDKIVDETYHNGIWF